MLLGHSIAPVDQDLFSRGGVAPVLQTAHFFSETNPGAAAADTGSYCMGTIIRVMENGNITKLRFWKTSDNVATSRDWAIYSGLDNDSTLLWSATGVTDSAGPGNWIECTVSPPLPVVWGQYIMPAVTTNRYTSTAGFFTNEVRRGPLDAIAQAGRYSAGAGLAKPDQVFGAPAYYVDATLEYAAGQVYYTPQNHVDESIIPAGYPTSATTGPTGVLTPASYVRSASNGQVIENLDIFGSVYVAHSNVTIRNCRIIGNTPYHVVQLDYNSGASNLTVQNCYINGMNFSVNAILGAGTFTGNCLVGVQNGINGTGTGSDNYINDMGGGAEAHFDGTETNGGSLSLSHNTILVGTSQTSAVMLNNEFSALTNCIINNNILVGGGYTVYCDNTKSANAVTNVQFTNNKMLPGQFGYFSLYTSGAVHTGNTNLTTGLSVD